MPYVSASDATHAAELTVRETFEFAAQCLHFADAEAGGAFHSIDDKVNAMLRALDLDHVADTVVGDENLRGISGGQKRRVTVGEMLMGVTSQDYSSSFLALEGITDGLSSQDSLHLIQRVQKSCKKYQMGAIISLLQPSDEIVACFDKLMVLSETGGLNYFGPIDREQLESVFLGSSSADAKGSICDLVLHPEATDDSDPELNLPSKEEFKVSDTTASSKEDSALPNEPFKVERAVRQRFGKSPASAELIERLNDIRWQAPPAHEFNDRIQEILPKNKYACDWKDQFKYIYKRRTKLVLRNAITYTRSAIAIFFGVIIGSLFGDLGFGLSGSLSRTGYMFLNCFLVLMLSAAITIPSTFRERVTLYKHRSAEFYSGRVAYFTQMMMDMPLSIFEASLLASTSYFWVDMNPGATHFFYFLGALIGLEFCGQALGRLLCATSRKQIFANIMSTIVILVFGTVAGFMPSYADIPPILQWLSWVTPASYAFEGVMINEFSGRTFGASASSGSSALSFSGEAWLSGFASMPRVNWATPTGIKLFNLFMLFVFSLVFDFLGCYYVEQNREGYFNTSRTSQETASSANFSDFSLRKKKEQDALVENENGNDLSTDTVQTAWPAALAIKDIRYFVFLKSKHAPLRFTILSCINPILVSICGKKKASDEAEPAVRTKEKSELQLLSNVNARFARGRMCALMGTSGAGKSTLLDVVAGYKTGGRIEGDILIDGYPKSPDVWKRVSAYAEQMDILNPYLSTMETLRFTASCRLGGTFAKRESVIRKVVKHMQLEEYLDMVVGREQDGEGLPKHARKRLTIAVQLVTLPKILFCDEPTTGLGTTAANIVMQALRRVTDKLNLITVVTIHQPSKPIWDSFDDLLLLVKGGNTAYFGPMGENSETVLDYFSSLPEAGPITSNSNPADYILSVVGAMEPENVAESYLQSDAHKDIVAQVDEDLATEAKTVAGETAFDEVRKEIREKRNFFRELLLLTKRHFWTQWRNPSYSLMRMISSFFVSLYMAILFKGDKSEITGAVFTIGAIFFLVFILVIPMQSSVVHLIEDRAVMYREVTSGLYTRYAYGLGQLLSDIPFHAFNTAIMFVMFYFIVDFQREPELIGYFIVMTFASNWAIMSLGQLYALALPNEESANGLAGLSVILSVIFMGFLITVNAMPSYWEWAYWTNLLHYIIQGFVTNELADNTYTLYLPDDILPVNASTAVFFSDGTDVSANSVASQASAFADLALQAGPGSNYDWNSSGIVVVGRLVQCLVAYDCLVEPVASNFINCTIFRTPIRFPPQDPVCQTEFRDALETVNVTELVKCLAPITDPNSTEADSDPLNAISAQSFETRDTRQDLEMIFCLLRLLLPDGLFDDIANAITELLKIVFGLIAVIVNILENGIPLPGEVILFVFGWAEFQEGEGLVAPWKWWYCLFSVGMFIAGLEVFKLLALRFVVWTKR